MKFCINALAAFSVIIFLLPVLSYAQNEFHLSNEFSLTYNDVSGPGAASSSLTEGIRHLNIFNMYGNGKTTDFDYSYTMGFKLTDDPRNDVKQLSLTNLQSRISTLKHVLTLGDTFESFSQYSLSTALKGGSYRYRGGACQKWCLFMATHIPAGTACGRTARQRQ
ncbi:MAG: hypothetical protein JXR79_07875 [Nitrospirae bacterium]|nr:hypothetical protein [Nitrospirota bacterium]